jgi:hypothetical protein
MRKFAFVFLAVFLALPFTLCAHAQTKASTDSADDTNKQSRYDFFVGAGITSTNQIVHSHGFLLGFEAGVTRNWGKYFGLNVQGAGMSDSLSSANQTVAGISPNYSQFLIGPELHATLYEQLSGGVHVLFGGSHTGGSGIVGTPDIAFSDGFGATLNYKVTPHFSIRLNGDRMGTSFVQGAASLGYTPHHYDNVQSSIGLVYHYK